MLGFLAFATCLALGAVSYGFLRPRGMFRRSALVLAAAMAAPYAIGYAVAPFLGDGAGMGVAFMLYALAALLAATAFFLALGAAAHHAWSALRKMG
jgi:hypothetical protein